MLRARMAVSWDSLRKPGLQLSKRCHPLDGAIGAAEFENRFNYLTIGRMWRVSVYARVLDTYFRQELGVSFGRTLNRFVTRYDTPYIID